MTNPGESLKVFARDCRGNVVVLFALLLTALAGFAAISVDYAVAYAAKSELQATAEAAALAGALALAKDDDVEDAVFAIAEINLPSDDYGNVVVAGDVQIGSYDSDTDVFSVNTNPNDAVRVIAERAESNGNAFPTIFGRIFEIETFDIEATAIATGVQGGPACIIALHPSANQSLMMDSNATLDLNGCEIVVNSDDDEAFYTDSNSGIVSEHNCVAGGFGEYSNSSISPEAEINCDPIDDPYASLPTPSTSGCDFNDTVIDSVTITINPGRYCDGLEIKNNAVVTFNSGNYIIKGKPFKVDSNSQVTGSGTMFYIHSDSSLEFDSNSALDLSAPTSGTYNGILFFQSRSNSVLARIDSNTVNNLTGVLYFPNNHLVLNSNSQMTSAGTCTQIVASTIEFNSNAGLDMDYDPATCPSGVQQQSARQEIVLVR